MSSGSTSERSEHLRKYRDAIRDAKNQGRFCGWFNCTTEAESVTTGRRDFYEHIWTEAAVRALPGRELAVEIGHGGGRVLNACAAHFGRVVGVDIHDERAELAVNAIGLRVSQNEIPLASGTVDFVYSLIVLHHMSDFGAFCEYLSETGRVLVEGGVAQLFYFPTDRDYLEIKGHGANHVSLRVSEARAHEEARRCGMKVIASGPTAGTQVFMTLQKVGR